MVAGNLHFPLIDPNAAGGVPLRVQVRQQHTAAQLPQRRRKIDRRSGFSHAALLVDDRDDFPH